jgi:phage antirepressor YoqD-like protein
MSEITKIETVRIGDDDVTVVRGPDGEGYAVVKRMCEAIGLDDDAQRAKLRVAPWAATLMIKATAPDGKAYECFCLHVKSVPMWLATIDVTRVALEGTRGKIARYQREASDVLWRWATGKMSAPQTLEQRALAVIADLKAVCETQAAQLEQARPAVEFVDRFVDSTGRYGLQQAGRVLGIGPNKFCQWLFDRGYVFRREGKLVPYQEYARREDDCGMGLFEVKALTYQGSDGGDRASCQTYVTPKGLRRFAGELAQQALVLA